MRHLTSAVVLTIATFTFFTLAILALWLDAAAPGAAVKRFAWLGCFAAALISALAAGIVQPLGLLWIGAFALSVGWFARTPAPSPLRVVSALAIVVLAAGLMAHRLPGFNNPRVISDARFTADALPFRLHLNFDKTVVGLFLLAFLHARLARAADWRAMFRTTLPVTFATVGTLLALSLAFGYVRFAPKLPPETWLFLWANLCLTCFAEEAFFRGFIQAGLGRKWKHLRHGARLALAIAAVLFGLAHFAGGPTYVALSTLAGVGYGWAYLRSGGRIEASILTHFAVNALHFLAFTYPALAPIGR